MISRFQLASLFRSEFFRHVATLVSGTTLAQAVPILIAPILTRIYTTEDYGLLAMFMSVSMVVSIVATLQYNHAVLLAEEDEHSVQLLHFCLIIVVAVTFLSILLVLVGNEALAAWFKFPELADWLYLLPLAVLLNGVIVVFTFWSNRKAKYARLSTAGIIAAIMTAVFSLGLGFMGFGVVGLVTGYLVGLLFRAAFLVIQSLRRESNLRVSTDFTIIKEQAKRFKKFPIFSLPSEFANTLVNRLPVFMISIFVPNAASTIGLFNMTNRILGLPTQLISGAVGSVFKQRASQEFHENGRCDRTFLISFKALLGIAIIPFAVLFIFAPDLFAFVFGEPWRDSGVYAQCLTILFFMRFISSPLTYMFSITSRQGEDFIMHLILLSLIFLGLYVGLVVLGNEIQAFWLFSIAYTLVYLYYLLRSYQFSKGL